MKILGRLVKYISSYAGGGSIDVFFGKYVMCCKQHQTSPIHVPLKSMEDFEVLYF